MAPHGPRGLASPLVVLAGHLMGKRKGKGEVMVKVVFVRGFGGDDGGWGGGAVGG